MTARGVTTPLNPAVAGPDDFTPLGDYAGAEPPEPVGQAAVVMAAYAIVSYLAQRYAPDVVTPELDALVQVFIGSLLAWRARNSVAAIKGLFERKS